MANTFRFFYYKISLYASLNDYKSYNEKVVNNITVKNIQMK